MGKLIDQPLTTAYDAKDLLQNRSKFWHEKLPIKSMRRLPPPEEVKEEVSTEPEVLKPKRPHPGKPRRGFERLRLRVNMMKPASRELVW